jgi:type IV pilus secretin PilQ/predicted competence protein
MRWLGGALVLLLVTAAGAADIAALAVKNVRVDPVGNGRRLTIELSRAPENVRDSMMTAPSRLVIDMAGAAVPGAPASFPLSDDVVSQVRVAARENGLRAVVALGRDPGAHAVRVDGTNVVADLGDVGTVDAAPPPAAAAPAAPSEVAAEAPTPWLGVRDVRVEPMDGGRRLVVSFTRTPDGVKDFVLAGPPRLVLDVRGPQPKVGALTRYPVTDDVVSGVRVASNGGALRIVADLRHAAKPNVHQDGMRLVAELADAAEETANAKPKDATKPTALAKPAPAAKQTAAKTKETKDVAPPPVGDGSPTAGAKPADVVEAPADVAPPPAVAVAPPPPPPPALREPPSSIPGPRVVSLAPVRSQGFGGQRISLDFKDADIQNVLRVLADVSGLNIIATDDVKGKVTLHLTDVPWDQALDLVLRSNRLEKTQDGNVVRISTVARLKEEREALRAAQDAEKELEPLRVKYLRVNYARADETLIEKVKGVLTDRGSVTFDDRTNTVIIRDIPRGIEDATDLVRELDVQSPQVLIEANIVEATRDLARALGIQWGYTHLSGPGTGNPTGLDFPGTFGVAGGGSNAGLNNGVGPRPAGAVSTSGVPFLADFPVPNGFSGFGAGTGSALDLALGSLDGVNTLSARLTALEEEGKAKVISRPRVITMNNVAATIQSLTILRVKLPSTGTVINTGTGGAAGSASAATEKINTGITLVVTPQISSDGYVLMNIFAKSSQPDFTSGRSVDGIPNEISREANSNVLIKNGETVVLGGIFRNTADNRETGIPYLRSIPALGWLFKRDLRTDHREELLVFVTPKIAAAGTASLPSAQKLWEERRQGG